MSVSKAAKLVHIMVHCDGNWLYGKEHIVTNVSCLPQQEKTRKCAVKLLYK